MISFITALSDADLASAAEESLLYSNTNRLAEGIVRKLAAKLTSELRIPEQTALKISCNEILEEAARRWIASRKA